MVLEDLDFFKSTCGKNGNVSAIKSNDLIPQNLLVVQAYHMSNVANRRLIK